MTSKGTQNSITSQDSIMIDNAREIALYDLDEYYWNYFGFRYDEIEDGLKHTQLEGENVRNFDDDPSNLLELRPDQYIDYLTDKINNNITKEEAQKFLDYLEKEGYRFEGISFIEGGNFNETESALSFQLGNQRISIEETVFKELMSKSNKYDMDIHEVLTHFSQDVPPILKVVGGEIQISEKGSGGFYRPSTGVIHIGAERVFGKKTATEDNYFNFKNVLEHELGHRLDYLGSFNPRISEHPYFKVLSQAFPTTAYSEGYRIQNSKSYRTEQMAETLAPMGTVRSRLTKNQKQNNFQGENTPNTPYNRAVQESLTKNKKWYDRGDLKYQRADGIPYREYIWTNPIISDIGYNIHSMKNVNKLLHFLDQSYIEYLENNI